MLYSTALDDHIATGSDTRSRVYGKIQSIKLGALFNA